MGAALGEVSVQFPFSVKHVRNLLDLAQGAIDDSNGAEAGSRPSQANTDVTQSYGAVVDAVTANLSSLGRSRPDLREEVNRLTRSWVLRSRHCWRNSAHAPSR